MDYLSVSQIGRVHMRKAVSRANKQEIPSAGATRERYGVDSPHSLDFRHIEAFRVVYEEGCYNAAAITLGATGRSVKKSMKDMRMILGGEMFTEGRDGTVSPTAFGTRLFNDTRQLDLAMARLIEKAEVIRSQGRVLRVGTTPAIFRTSAFRTIFRELQTMEGFRLSYVQLGKVGCAKALQQGLCDWYLGFDGGLGERFASAHIMEIPLRDYIRGRSTGARRTALHSPTPPERCASGRRGKLPGNIIPIPEERWIHWLDHPADCEEGILVRSPEMAMDSRFWTELEETPGGSGTLALHATHLKHHPFEFLPGLAAEVQNRI